MVFADAWDVWRAYTFEADALKWLDTASDAGGRAPCHVTRLRADRYFVDYVDLTERATSVSVVIDVARRVDIGDRHTPSNANVPRRLRLRAIDTPSPLRRPTVHGRARRPSYSQPLWMNSTTEYRRRSSACCRTASTIRDTPSA